MSNVMLVFMGVMFVKVKDSWDDPIFEDISKLRLGSSNLTTMFYM